MMHHYITKYMEDGKLKCESWLQLNVLGLCFCFSRRVIEIKEQLCR